LHYFSRWEMFAIVGALGLLVVGVSLAAVPTETPNPARTKVEGAYAVASPTPPAASPAAPASAAPAPASPVAVAAPVTVAGPSHLTRWATVNYQVTFLGSGTRSVAVWWTGVTMANWTWQRLDGHCQLTPGRDRLSGWASGQVVLQLRLTPSGPPGGQLVFYGSEGGGQPITLAAASVS
jgi:hypothetical protein